VVQENADVRDYTSDSDREPIAAEFQAQLKEQDWCLTAQEIAIVDLKALFCRYTLTGHGVVPSSLGHPTVESIRPTIPNQGLRVHSQYTLEYVSM